jgi:hypothetical protein
LIVSLVLQKLTDALLEMEEERAIWSAKEKASIEAIEHKAKLYNREIASLSRETSEVGFIFTSVHHQEFPASPKYSMISFLSSVLSILP